jgi:hypothetical protein
MKKAALNRVEFPGATGFPTVSAQPTDSGLEFGATFPDATGSAQVQFVLDPGSPSLSVTLDGQRLQVASASGTVGLIDAPTLVEGPDQVAVDSSELTVNLVARGDGTYLLTYAIDPTWFHDASRQFPIALDPSVCTGVGVSSCTNDAGHLETYIQSAQPDTYVVSPSWMRVGYSTTADGFQNMRSLIYFTPLTLADGAQVTSATLALREDDNQAGATTDSIQSRLISKTWGTTSTWNQVQANVVSGYDSPSAHACSSGSTDCTVSLDVTAAVRANYTRRYQDWKAGYGFQVREATEGSTHKEIRFYLSSDPTTANRPKLTINYVVPQISIDFDSALGPTYAPSQMIAGQATRLPIIVRNNSSGFTFNHTAAADYYRVGYRWLDTKGNVLSSATATMPADAASGGSTGLFGLSVTAPSTAGQYTLRLDLVHTITPYGDLWSSDWATPSKYFSRNKKILTSDSTRWTGSSAVEREEYPINVTSGDAGGDTESVTTGTGDELGINLASKNLSYTGDTELGFKDLIPHDVGYGYNGNDATSCAAYQGVLGACGWYTNWDERFTAGSSTGDFTYQGPSGARYLVDTDPDGQLVSSAPVRLSRTRSTLIDENRPTSTPSNLVSAASVGLSAPSGTMILQTPSNTSTTVLAGMPGIDLQSFGTADFAVRTSAAASAGITYKVHDVQKNADTWFIYTVGASWTTGFPQVNLGLQTGQCGSLTGCWNYYRHNLLSDVLGQLPSGWSATDTLQVTGANVQSSSGSNTGSTYVDGWFLEPVIRNSITDTNPSWTTGGTGTSTNTSDFVVGTASSQVPSAAISASPDCTSACFNGGASLQLDANYPFVHWWWKKVGGTGVAVVVHLKDTRSGQTGDITYYAGPSAPSGAVHAIQVTPTVPTGWSREIRNVLEDGRQVLNFFNDASSSGDGSPDPVAMTGFEVSGVDGNYALVDDLGYSSIADAVDTDRWGHDDEYAYPDATHNSYTANSLPALYDFRAEYADGSTHFFNRDGLLTRITDRDANAISLDYTIASGVATTQSAYALTTIHSPTDATTSASTTFDREVTVAVATGSPLNSVTFTEKLGATSSDVSTRAAVFYVASATGTTYGIGDLVKLSPARHSPTTTCGSAPSGCTEFNYTDTTNHRLAQVKDPRDSGSNNYHFDVTWDTSANATGDGEVHPDRIKDASHGSQALLAIVKFDRSDVSGLAYTRPLYQDSSAVAAGFAMHEDLSPDGTVLVTYAPQACTAGNCVTNMPPGDSATLDNRRATEQTFDGLGRSSGLTTYRCTGVAVGGCGAAELISVTRQGTNASAKVDNYVDALASDELAWQQSADQYFASMRDSGGRNPDLYRTEFAYNGYHQLVDTVSPSENQNPNYPSAVEETWYAKGYWRMNETSGVPMADASGNGLTGSYSGSPTLGGAGGLIRDGQNKAPTFNGSTQYASVPDTGIGTISGDYTVEAWVNTSAADVDQTFVGTRNGSDKTFDAKFCVDQTYCSTPSIRMDVGDGTNWLLSGNVQFAWQANRWYQVVIAVNSSTQDVAVYVDGRLIGRLGFTTPGTPLLMNSTRNLYFGQNGRGQEWWTGSIDEASLYTTALDAGRVRFHYEAGAAISDVHTELDYDREGHVVYSDDEDLLNAGFESGTYGWQIANSGGSWHHAASSGDALVHSGFGSFDATADGLIQEVQLVPGQTFRVQFWNKEDVNGTVAAFAGYYWNNATAVWTPFLSGTDGSLSWSAHAYDVTLPTTNTDGRVRLDLWNNNHTGHVYFDDAAIVTDTSSSTYGGNGLPIDETALTATNGSRRSARRRPIPITRPARRAPRSIPASSRRRSPRTTCRDRLRRRPRTWRRARPTTPGDARSRQPTRTGSTLRPHRSPPTRPISRRAPTSSATSRRSRTTPSATRPR